MGQGRLDPLQERVLSVLAAACPGWRLTGGAALAGFHLAHRTTRDLDLLWGGHERLGRVPEEVRVALAADRLSVATVQTTPSFHRFRVTDGSFVTVLDLVAEPVAPVELPEVHRHGETEVLVDTPHEILVNKLCALIQRSELRDLVDVHRLLDSGGDLRRALEDAPRKDSGFSPLALAWSLKELPMSAQAKAEGWPEDRIAAVQHCIQAHRYRDLSTSPQTLEARVVFDV